MEIFPCRYLAVSRAQKSREFSDKKLPGTVLRRESSEERKDLETNIIIFQQKTSPDFTAGRGKLIKIMEK